MKNIFRFLLLLLICSQFFAAAQSSKYRHLVGSNLEAAMNPVYSPDGTMIAFTKGSYTGIYVYNLETDNITQITDELSAGYGFKWSSDSKSILSRVARYEGPRRFNSLMIFDVQSGAPTQISEESTSMPYLPEWAPGNNKVILPQRDGLKIFETGKEPFFLENESPVVVYSLNDKIVVKDFSNETETVLVPFNGQKYLNVILSPDKSKIAFELYGGNLFVMNIDGSGLIDLDEGYNPKWSPDSKSLVYMITEDDGHAFTSADIFMINVDGMNKRNLTNTEDEIELNPSISPDGKTIVFESFLNGSIYLMNLD